MNKQLYTILLILILNLGGLNFTLAQNLIPNGDFEQYVSCPASFSQIDSAIFWTTPTSLVSTDYFNTCAPQSTLIGVPINMGTGFQYPHSGNAYAGFFLLASVPNLREYIEVELTSPLAAGQCYNLNMYVNLFNSCDLTSDDLQVYFSDTLLNNIPIIGILPYMPQIENPQGNYFDTLSWNYVQMNYTAAGGEKYIVMGNFKSDANTSVQQINSIGFPAVYVYIDDVVLSVCTSISNHEEYSEIHLFPEPFTDEISITTDNNTTATIEIYNVLSQRVILEKFYRSVTFNTSSLPSGSYYYKVYNSKNILGSGKLNKP